MERMTVSARRSGSTMRGLQRSGWSWWRWKGRVTDLLKPLHLSEWSKDAQLRGLQCLSRLIPSVSLDPYLQSPGSLSEIVHVSVWYAEAIGSHDRSILILVVFVAAAMRTSDSESPTRKSSGRVGANMDLI